MTIQALAFNTGRQYTREGQRIVAKVLSTEPDEHLPMHRFAFADLDRGIYGRATCFGEFNQNNIMAAYDAGNYEGTWSDRDFHDAHAYYRELTA
jgi:hypothetical protein